MSGNPQTTITLPNETVQYTVLFTNPTAYAAAVAANGGSTTYLASPSAAAAAFGLPIGTANPASPPGEIFISDFNTFFFDINYNTTGLAHFPANGSGETNHRVTLDIRTQAGVPSFVLDYYQDIAGANNGGNHYIVTYTWHGILTLQGTNPVPLAPATIQARRWVQGFEIPEGNSDNANFSPANFSRAASRCTDGYGWEMTSGVVGTQRQVTSPTGAGARPTSSWERFYIRVRARPSVDEISVWGATEDTEGQRETLHLTVTAAGNLRLRNVGGTSAFPGTVIGTLATPLTLNTWYKIDIFLTFSPGPSGVSNPGGTVSVFVNNVAWLSGVVVAPGSTSGANGTGLGFPGAKHYGSVVGNFQTGSAGAGVPTLYAIDIDDWICANLPPASATTGPDFRNGSHVRKVLPTGFGPGNGTWTGDFRTLQNWPIPGGVNGPAVVSSSTVSTPLVVTTDYTDIQLGCVALVSAILHQSVPVAITQHGYQIGAGAQVLANSAVSATSNTWIGVLHNLATGLSAPPAISALNLIMVRTATAGTVTVNTMIGAAEYLGIFGPEDAPSDATETPLPHTGVHNAPYPDHPVAADRSLTVNAKALTGTYVGNGTGQDIVTTDPIHLLFIRPVGVTANGVYWWSSLTVGHTGMDGAFAANNLTSAYPLSGANAGFRVDAGTTQSNVVGVTYRWVGISDPSARFVLNTAYFWNAAVTSAVNALVDAGFTPEAAFAWLESTGSANTLYYRGPGHATDKASPFTLAEVANLYSFGAGSLTSKSGIHLNSGPGQAYSTLRSVDADGVSGLIDMVTYVGDGLASRNIPVQLGGFAPLYTMGFGHTTGLGGFTWIRDPSHTGLDASSIAGAIATNAIINHSFADTVVVGAALNTLGVTYDLFVISSILVAPPALAATCPSSAATKDIPYSQPVGVIGGFSPYTFTLTAGPLPPGLTLSDGSVVASGLIYGTPTTLGVYPYTIQVRDSSGNTVSVSCSITVSVGGGGGPLAVGCATGTGAIAAPYDALIPASGGAPPYTFALIAGALPPGLVLNTATGRITGVPTTAGIYSYTVQVTDALAATATTVCAITIATVVITPPPLGACLACTTLTDAIALLALRLQDSGLVHWTALELTRYLVEAVRTWQALTSNTIEQGSFFTATNAPFYDIPTVLPALRAYTLRDRDLILDIEYALMEPPTPTAWTGTPQFILNDLVVALEHRRDRFLYETGMIVNRFLMTVLSPPASGRIAFDPSIMTIRRVAYQNTLTGATYPLSRDDEWSLQSFLRTWPAQTALPATRDPQVYSVGLTPPLTLQVGPPLSSPGVLDLLVISRTGVGGQTTPCLDPNNGSGIFLGVPDDWAWVVKFGALAELLNQQGVTYDPQRAGYCESRWRHGLSLARTASTVLAARINGQPISLDSVPNFDSYRRSWQRTSGVPTAGGLAGNNLVALTPVPTGAGHTVTLDLVRNMPVPAVGADCVGMEGEALDALLDYAQHLALFKEGPEQLRGSMDLLDRFFRFAGVTTGIGWASSINFPALANQTRSDERFLPRQIAPPDDTGGSGGSSTSSGGPA